MEKLSYEEVKGWFWTRTLVWTFLAAVVSAVAFFFYSVDIEGLQALFTRIWVSALCGLFVTLIGLLAACISMQFPWTRRGWRRGFVLNGPICALIAGFGALFLSGILVSLLQNNPPNDVGEFVDRDKVEAYTQMIDAAFLLMRLGIGAAAFWGFIFGCWFSLRRDKYFVEQL